MKATLPNGTIFEGTSQEIRATLKILGIKPTMPTRTDTGLETHKKNALNTPKIRRHKKAKSAKIMRTICEEYGIDESKLLRELNDPSKAYTDVAADLKVPAHRISLARKLLRREGKLAFRYARTAKFQNRVGNRMRLAAKMVRKHKVKHMRDAMKLLKKKGMTR